MGERTSVAASGGFEKDIPFWGWLFKPFIESSLGGEMLHSAFLGGQDRVEQALNLLHFGGLLRLVRRSRRGEPGALESRFGPSAWGWRVRPGSQRRTFSLESRPPVRQSAPQRTPAPGIVRKNIPTPEPGNMPGSAAGRMPTALQAGQHSEMPNATVAPG